MRARQLEVFRAVMRSATVTGAAKALNLATRAEPNRSPSRGRVRLSSVRAREGTPRTEGRGKGDGMRWRTNLKSRSKSPASLLSVNRSMYAGCDVLNIMASVQIDAV
jgi:hypothetical protein